MSLFQRVLVPLSLSDADGDLLRYINMVIRLDISTHVRFVHVVTPPHESPETSEQALEEQMAALVRQSLGSALDQVQVEYRVVSGVRIDQLVTSAIEHRSDLILLGHRQHRSGQRSLARRLAMITPCSVWVVPQETPPQIQRILAPIDFSEHSADSLSQAAALARLSGLEECLALHVFFDPSTVRYDEHINEVRGREEQALREFLAQVNSHGVTIERAFEESANVARAIQRATEKHAADLLVMSTRGRSRAASILLGSVTSQVIAESRVPVLAVKHYGSHLNLLQALQASQFWSRPNPKTN